MNVNLNRTIKPISLSIVLLLLLGFQFKESQAQETSLAKATFYVYWYDVGKSALEGLKGVKKVENGWHHLKEINRVYYDPAAITIGEMEAALKRVKTYQGTAGVAEDKWWLSEFTPPNHTSAKLRIYKRIHCWNTCKIQRLKSCRTCRSTRDLIGFSFCIFILLHRINKLRYNSINMWSSGCISQYRIS